MELRLLPDPDDLTVEVVERAVTAAGIDLGEWPAGYTGAWRKASLGEAAHHSDPVAAAVADYALSPRSTRGATRA